MVLMQARGLHGVARGCVHFWTMLTEHLVSAIVVVMLMFGRKHLRRPGAAVDSAMLFFAAEGLFARFPGAKVKGGLRPLSLPIQLHISGRYRPAQ